MSDLEHFLTTDYAQHFGVTWDSSVMIIRKETPSSVHFEIEDQQPAIIQPATKGVSVFRRNDTFAEVIDLEEFMKQIHGTAHTPSTCDFVLSPSVGTQYLVFNELSRTQSGYILQFRQQDSGEEQEGKLEKARRQLTETINRFYAVSDFCERYENKTALFSCRLSDKRSNGIMARSSKMFNKTIYKLQRMTLHEELPHGFLFKIRIYNAEYELN